MAYEKSKVSKAGQGSLDRLPLVGFEYCHQVSSVPGEEIGPSELAEGELALNAGDGRLLYKTPSAKARCLTRSRSPNFVTSTL